MSWLKPLYILIAVFVFIAPVGCGDGGGPGASSTSGTGGGVAYKVYYGNSSYSYTTTLNVGNITSYTVIGLSSGKYYFNVTARTADGKESFFTRELIKTFPPGGGYSVTLLWDAATQRLDGTAL